MKRLLITLAVLFACQFMFGWGKLGHRIVAQICYDNLSKKAKNAVDEALGNEYLTHISNWPDHIRSERGWKFVDSWHYATINPDKTVAGISEEAGQNDKIDNIIEAIELMKSILNEDQASIEKFQKLMKKNKVEPLQGSIEATALAFLIHFMGDVHQPMHVGKNRDLGGNKITVLYFGDRTSLHAVWDTKIIQHEELSFTEFSALIQKHLSPKKDSYQHGNLIDWAQQTVADREVLYNTLYDNTDREAGLPSFSYQYQHDFIPMVERKLAEAGYRSAMILNEIYK